MPFTANFTITSLTSFGIPLPNTYAKVTSISGDPAGQLTATVTFWASKEACLAGATPVQQYTYPFVAPTDLLSQVETTILGSIQGIVGAENVTQVSS
jgi:hypothetical protein